MYSSLFLESIPDIALRQFYNLEKLGNAEDKIALEKLTPDVLSLYRSFKPLLEPFSKSLEQEKSAVSTEEMIETLKQLRNAIDSFDLDEADRAMHKLEGYAFPENCRLKTRHPAKLCSVVLSKDMKRAHNLL